MNPTSADAPAGAGDVAVERSRTELDTRATNLPHRSLDKAGSLLSDLEGDEAGLFLAAAADLTVVLDADAKVERVSYADPDLGAFAPDEWIGRTFETCVTPESVEKARALVSDAVSGPVLTARQVNHPRSDAPDPGADLAVSYRAVRIRRDDRTVLFGTELRTVADAQTRLLRAQLRFDRESRRAYEAETRYRLLFKLADTPMLIVEASSLAIADANEAAATLFDRPARKLVELVAPAVVSRPDQAGLAATLAEAAATGRTTSTEVTVRKGDPATLLEVTPYRELGGNHLLVVASGVDPDHVVGFESDPLPAIIDAMPDGIVILDKGGSILHANDGMLDLVRATNRDRLIGRRADRWLGATSVDMQVLLGSLRDHGSIRRFDTVVRDELGETRSVEVSGASTGGSSDPVYGFVIREAEEPAEPTVADQDIVGGNFADLVGRVSLRELVRDTADIIERMCIEEALRQTDNNRASAADMLGLSRQSLYMKLKRYGLEDGPRDSGA